MENKHRQRLRHYRTSVLCPPNTLERHPHMTITTWATPQYFFDMLNEEFNFTLDVCALPETAKCDRYYTPEIDALKQDWTGETFFMNPPYGRGQDVYSWIKKAFESAKKGGTGVCLLPASVDTKWFHEFVLKANEIRFVKDRLWFELNGKAARANHGSIVVIFKQYEYLHSPKISHISNGRTKTK
jgi:phage N-6-adenine-methyltransferase